MADTQPKQKIGLWTSTSLVVGNMIGAGVFLTPAAMASFGSISLLGWLFAAIGSFFLAKVFSNLSKLLPRATGGPYAYSRHGLGDFAGFLIAWGYYLSNACALAAIVVSFISAMSTFFPVLNASPVAAVSLALVTVWFLTYINSLGIVTSGIMQLITSILKLTPLILIALVGLFFIKAKNFLPFNPGGGSIISAISNSAAIAMFSFVGFESATVPAGEVEDPGNTVSKATMLGFFICTAVFVLGSVSIMGMIPAKILATSPTPYSDTADIMFGHGARYIVSAGMAIAAFGAINGWTLVQGQLLMAVAKDKLFPPVFARINKHHAPWVGMVVNSVLVSIFITMNYGKGLVDIFKVLMLLAVLTTLVPYLFSVAAYPIIRAKEKRTTGWTAAIILAVVGFSYALWEIAGSGEEAVFDGFILIMAGIPFYIWQHVYKKQSD
jgi:basic amino acid/polyamine antiporter, APA family